MKKCAKCGTNLEDAAQQCFCGSRFFRVGSSDEATAQSAAHDGSETSLKERPDGSKVMALGWLFFIGSIVALFVALNTINTNLKFLSQVLASGFFSLFLFLWSVGYIVRAISFLPGRDE